MQFRWKWPLNLKSLLMLAASIAPLATYGLAHDAFPPSWQGPIRAGLVLYTGAMAYAHHAAVPDVQDPGVMNASGGTGPDAPKAAA